MDTNICQITSVEIVEDIPREIKFWESLGFEVTVTIPSDESIGFAILDNGDLEIMLQTPASLEADSAVIAAALDGRKSYLYLHVTDLAKAKAKVVDGNILIDQRETFYGTRETFYQTGSGEVVGLAERIVAE